MKKLLTLTGSLFLSLIIAGSSMADLSNVKKQKEKSKSQREQAEQNVKKRQDKELQDKQKELANKQKQHQMQSQIIKSKHDMNKNIISNIK